MCNESKVKVPTYSRFFFDILGEPLLWVVPPGVKVLQIIIRVTELFLPNKQKKLMEKKKIVS